MNDLRQAAQQALEALDKATRFMSDSDYKKLNQAIDDLRAALAEPEQPHDLSCICGAEWDIYSDGREELVAAPTPRKPLTDEEILAEMPVAEHRPIISFARAIEEAVWKKNS